MEKQYFGCTDIETFDQVIENLHSEGQWVLDIEGTSLDFQTNKLIGIGFSWKRYCGVYVPLRKYIPIIGLTDLWGENQLYVVEKLKQVLQNGSAKAAHNAKYDVECIWHEWGFQTKIAIDTMLLCSITLPSRDKYSLDSMSYLYDDLKGYKDKMAGKDLSRQPLPDLIEYNCSDTDLTWRLVEDNISIIEKNDKFYKLFIDLLMPLSDLITRMEFKGIRIDNDYSKQLHRELYEELNRLNKEIFEATGVRLNPRSHSQLADLLFNKLKLPIKEKYLTKSKNPGVGKEVLKDLQKIVNNPVFAKIMTFKTLAANKTGFVDSCVRPRDRKDNLEKDYLPDKLGYLHGNYKLISKTGRLRSGSSDDEGDVDGNSRNMQNVPRDKRFKRMYLPDKGHVFCGADYAQLELRVLAHICGDKELLRAFEQDYDPHCLVGSEMAGTNYEEVLVRYQRGDSYKFSNGMTAKEIRDLSKNIGFGWVYRALLGRFAYLFPGINDKAKVEAERAAKERYFDRFSRILPWEASELDKARELGYYITLSGRKIMCPMINSEDKRARSHAEKQVINGHIQGPASELNCYAAVQFDYWIQEKDYEARILNLVHDAIYSSLLFNISEEAYWKKKEIMETCGKDFLGLKVKMKADIKLWDRWEGEEIVKYQQGKVEEEEKIEEDLEEELIEE